jgi:hypothetical protein
MEPNSICPKCKEKMEQGFVVDYGHGNTTVSHWSAGEPQRCFPWGGVIVKDQRQITTYRCTECGYLESYAR